jgi:hypothetical protein
MKGRLFCTSVALALTSMEPGNAILFSDLIIRWFVGDSEDKDGTFLQVIDRFLQCYTAAPATTL